MVKKIVFIVFGATFAAVFIIASLATLHPSFFIELFNPELTTKVHRVSSLNQQIASVDIEVGLHNKTFIPVEVNVANFLVEMDGQKIANSSKPFEVVIKPLSKNNIHIPLELQMSILKRHTLSFNPSKIDSSTYKVFIQYEMRTLFGISDSSTFTAIYYYPTFGVPKAEIKKVELLESRLRKQRLKIQVGIINPNPNDIIIDSPSYAIQIDDREGFISSSLGRQLVLKKYSTTPKTLFVEIENKKVLQLIGEIIGNGKDMALKLMFTGELNNDSDIIKNCDIKIEVNGDLRSLIEASKKM